MDFDAISALEDALVREALGVEETSRNVRQVVDARDRVIETIRSVSTKPGVANASLIRQLLDEQVGGPKDWC